MMVDDNSIKRMLARFEGYHKAYGMYDPKRTVTDLHDGKIEIKMSAKTWPGEPGVDLWAAHLNGKVPLGIIPIRENNTCRWGCIDIDDYHTDVPELLKRIAKEELPLIICQSKSGGAHLFLFMADFVPAILMQLCLKDMAAALGHGQVEVFPKQRVVNWAHGDLGSWLNMPYFGDARRAYDPISGELLTLEQFLDLADSYAQPPQWIEVDFIQQTKNKSAGVIGGGPDFGDGPPCLQHLSSIGISEGNRNNGVMALGVFAKKKYSANWQEMLEQWNREFIKPPLSATELADLIKRLGKKEYHYRCKDQPIVAYCNSAICRTRKFGVDSKENSVPHISGLSVLLTDPPLWFVDVGDHRMELTTETLMNYNDFRRVCLQETHEMYMPMKQDSWAVVIKDLLKGLTTIEVSAEVGLPGMFAELLGDFLSGEDEDDRVSRLADQKSELLLGHPWLDDSSENPDNHRYYFRLRDLQKFLRDANFKSYTAPQLTTRITSLGGGSKFFKIKDVGVNTWWVPKGFRKPIPRIMPVPPEGSPI